jgi:hypothetical protein
VVNVVSSWYLESANHCSGPFDPDVNEMELAGMTTLPSHVVKPPRVGEAAVHLECEVSCKLRVGRCVAPTEPFIPMLTVNRLLVFSRTTMLLTSTQCLWLRDASSAYMCTRACSLTPAPHNPIRTGPWWTGKSSCPWGDWAERLIRW